MKNSNVEKFGISQKSYNMIVDLFSKFPEVEKVVIFGSRAMGTAKKNSDIDFAIYGKDLNDEIIRKIRITLNEKLNIPYFIDVINYASIDNIDLKKHIDNEGKIFWTNYD